MYLVQTNYNILEYIIQQTGAAPKKLGNKILLNPCPICGHKDHFYVYPVTNSYSSFATCCKGGTIIDWLQEYEHLSLPEAMQKVAGDTIPINKQKQQEVEKLASLLTEKVEGFFNACIERYKFFKFAESAFRAEGIEYTDSFYRWIRQGLRFFDRVTEQFINSSFEERVKLMRNYKESYFYKLQRGVVTKGE